MGFSPGGIHAPFIRGHTRAFVSHGTTDTTLSYKNSRDGIVPTIEALRVPVTFSSFTGGHTIPVTVAHSALQFALAS